MNRYAAFCIIALAILIPANVTGVTQHDAELLYLWEKFLEFPGGSTRRFEAQKELADALAHRTHIDISFKLIGGLLFGSDKSTQVLRAIPTDVQAYVEGINCIKSMERIFERYCGALLDYGLTHMLSITNICDAGVRTEKMEEVCALACSTFPSNSQSSLKRLFHD